MGDAQNKHVFLRRDRLLVKEKYFGRLVKRVDVKPARGAEIDAYK
jgi:hypothetical protein